MFRLWYLLHITIGNKIREKHDVKYVHRLRNFLDITLTVDNKVERHPCSRMFFRHNILWKSMTQTKRTHTSDFAKMFCIKCVLARDITHEEQQPHVCRETLFCCDVSRWNSTESCPNYETKVAIFSSVSGMATCLSKQVNYNKPEVEKVTLKNHNFKYLFMVCDILRE